MDTSVWVQTCYLEFVFGLASILLAAIFMLFTKNYRQGLPWAWLFLFGFLNGTGFWVGIAAQHLPLSYLTLTASFLKVMALLALVEFARAGTGQIRRRGPGLWLSGLVLFASLTFAVLFRDGVIIVQSVLGFAGALWSALVFWWAAKREEITSQSRLLQVTSVTLAVFASTYLVGPQLIMGTALVSLMALTIIHYLRKVQLSFFQEYSQSKHGKSTVWFLVIIFIAMFGWFVINYVMEYNLDQLWESAQQDGELLRDQLSSEFEQYQGIVTALSGSRALVSLLAGNAEDMDNANNVIDRNKTVLADADIYLLDKDGTCIISTNRQDADSFVGHNYQFRPNFQEAASGRTASYFAVGVTSKERGYYVSRMVRDQEGRNLGVLVLKVPVTHFEASMRQFDNTFLVSPEGIIFLSSRPEFILKSFRPLDEGTKQLLLESRQFGEGPFLPLLTKEEDNGNKVEINNDSFMVSRFLVDENSWAIVILTSLSIIRVYIFLTIVGILLLCLLTLAFWVSAKRVMDSAMEIAINKISEGQRLVKQRNYYQSLLDNLPIPLWQTNAEGGLIWINQTGLKFVGLSLEEMMGQGLTRIVHPDDRAEALSAFWRHFNERLFGQNEFRVRRHDGQYRWIVCVGGPYLDQDRNYGGIMGVFYNITEKKNAEEKAQEIHRKISDERNQLFSVLESVPIAIYVTDAEHKIYFANRKFRETHGQSRAGKCYEIIHNREEPCLNCPASKVLETGIPEKIEFLWTGDLVYDVYYHPFTGTNGTPLVLELMIDITEQKNIQAILRKAKDEAEAASRSKSLFLANMSHEIRTPMNGILGMTELALDTDLNSEQRDYLNMVQASAKSLLRVINDILDFSKIEAGRMTLDVVPFKIRDIINQTTETISVLAEDQRLSLKRNVANDVPDILFGDPDRLRQVLFNLMGNAVKFTEKGEVAVKVNLVSRSNDEKTCVLKFSIADSGMGIPEEKLHRLFHRFSQVDESLTRKHGGTGLGLAISKQIVEMMGGAIGVESELGAGSTFYFTAVFGSAKGAEKTNRQHPDIHEQSSQSVGEVRQILLAEDNNVNRKLAEILLERKGWHAFSVENGREAVEAWKNNQFHLILMDIQMPKMGGVEAVKEIRELEKQTGSHIPIIALTANVMEGDKQKYLEAGMDGYISKPLIAEELYAVIDEMTDD